MKTFEEALVEYTSAFLALVESGTLPSVAKEQLAAQRRESLNYASAHGISKSFRLDQAEKRIEAQVSGIKLTPVAEEAYG